MRKADSRSQTGPGLKEEKCRRLRLVVSFPFPLRHRRWVKCLSKIQLTDGVSEYQRNIESSKPSFNPQPSGEDQGRHSRRSSPDGCGLNECHRDHSSCRRVDRNRVAPTWPGRCPRSSGLLPRQPERHRSSNPRDSGDGSEAGEDDLCLTLLEFGQAATLPIPRKWEAEISWRSTDHAIA